MWDTREKSAPVNRTSLSDGHTQPVFAFATVPAVNKLHNIVSLSSDGQLCVWSDNDLHAPSTQLQLKHGKDHKEEVKTAPACLSAALMHCIDLLCRSASLLLCCAVVCCADHKQCVRLSCA